MTFSFESVKQDMDVSVNSDGRLVKKYVDTYLAKSTTELTRDQVASGIGVLPGAPHPNWSFATCNNIKISRRPTRAPHCAWDATYSYATDAVVPSDTASTDPTLRRVNRTTGHTQQQRFIIKDKTGVLITDAAGSPFDGGVPVTDWLGTITWRRDETHSSTSQSQAVQLTGKLNSTTFMGCAAETLMLDVTGEEKWEGSYHFWTFTYTMTYDKDGWQPAPANAGLWKKVSGKRVRITEGDGTDAQQPQPLTTGGDVVPVASRPSACNFIDVDHYNTMDFADLSLPTT